MSSIAWPPQVFAVRRHLSLALFHQTPSILQLLQPPWLKRLLSIPPDEPTASQIHVLLIARIRTGTAQQRPDPFTFEYPHAVASLNLPS